MPISLIIVSSAFGKVPGTYRHSRNMWEMNEWMRFSSNYPALLNHTELTSNHDPKPFMSFLIKPYLPLPFLHRRPHAQMTAFYDLRASIILSCQDHFGPWLCHCTCLLFFPVSVFHKCDQLSSIFSFKLLIAMKTQSPPCSLPQQIALQSDMNPLITTLLSHSARCKSTWPHY